MRLEYQDSIDRYLLNRMSEEERILFEDKCAENSELKEQLEHTQDVRVAISDRNEMLKRIQAWDDEYDAKVKQKKVAAHKMRVSFIWISGIAAVVILGYFLLPLDDMTDVERNGTLVAMKQEESGSVSVDNQSDILVNNDSSPQNLLAQSEKVEVHTGEDASVVNETQVFSFGHDSFETSREPDEDGGEMELRKVKEEEAMIEESITQQSLLLLSGEISRDVYNSKLLQLRGQKDEARWKEAMILLNNKRKDDALEILDEIRTTDGHLQSRADSLYKKLCQ